MADFTLRSPDIEPGGAIPVKFSCDGENVSPALAWEGAPPETAAFALIVDDPDARGFVHWVAFNLTASQTGALPTAISSSPDAPPQGRNGFGGLGYGGPCPPAGPAHHYVFTLYALSAPVELAGQPTAQQLRDAIAGIEIAQASFTATYERRR